MTENQFYMVYHTAQGENSKNKGTEPASTFNKHLQ